MKEKKEIGIGDRLRSIRKALGLSQATLAKALNMVPSSLSGIENNRNMPSINSLLILKEKFDVNLLYLLANEGGMFTTSNSREHYTVDYKKLKIIPREVTEFLKMFEKSSYLQFKVMEHYKLIKYSNSIVLESDAT